MRAKILPQDCQPLTIDFFCARVVPTGVENVPESAESFGYLRVVWTQTLSPNRKRFAIERLGPAVISLVHQEPPEIIKT